MIIMGKLQKQIYADYTAIVSDKTTINNSWFKTLRDNLKFVIGELQRQPTKELTDEQVVGIFKKLVKSIKEIPAELSEKDVELISLLEKYLPKEATEEEIISFIKTIDFSKYNNKMQAMKEIMQHFGSAVDGNKVKTILLNT